MEIVRGLQGRSGIAGDSGMILGELLEPGLRIRRLDGSSVSGAGVDQRTGSRSCVGIQQFLEPWGSPRAHPDRRVASTLVSTSSSVGDRSLRGAGIGIEVQAKGRFIAGRFETEVHDPVASFPTSSTTPSKPPGCGSGRCRRRTSS